MNNVYSILSYQIEPGTNYPQFNIQPVAVMGYIYTKSGIFFNITSKDKQYNISLKHTNSFELAIHRSLKYLYAISSYEK